ncbi:MAG: class III poly(R)-hydroxyalkanoic acid synthase subunit PhaE [Cyanobacteria bacterium SW_5_48_44]|jgi:class III poly(R)-hydroxyalkanoic acid synthase PhaE subunit|nr:MAG: class III poly(R)-hydroxyalkanoic acid synthase subunit PhaE [Cyanobacteria bacterium QS_1_48_34]PSP08388.1 MAG: class III poly(R)-hydroxyalkanoic acid synthase subunit PhaE [Cyanobacteria bacterium SW_7_48_12]PSP10418.1 MAG: class III poly(R)-hydroxyalkanoic acid synthase subunit PhaE [Cyanobacteria bacterium SW_11_48_12]PSP22514.1 MAG: class III poly(R)-hydroxyalkanoic acid synthase subunit PhaE [Cyanobacteria bacterium SW_5_48_44]PSP35322.1 MAG: class III poly(R)-hydroxyalkanoic acid
MAKETNGWSEIANAWAETGTQMWKSWFNLMGSVPKSNPVADAQPEGEDVAQQFADNQELLGRFLTLSFNAWKDISPKVEAGEDWQQLLSKYTEQIRKQVGTFTQNTTELWQLYIQHMQKFSQLWASSMWASVAPMSKTATGTSEPWIELNNIYWNLLYEESFGSLMGSPFLGPTREFNRKLMGAFDAWTNLYRASVDYQAVLAEIQVRSFKKLMQELVSLAEQGEKVENWKQFQQLGSRIADGVFQEALSYERNLKIRGKYLNALNTYQLHQQEVMELWMKKMNMPLRSEVDEVHQSIYELRKEVKALKKALAKDKASQQQTQPQRSEMDELRQSIEELREDIKTLSEAQRQPSKTTSLNSNNSKEQ